MMTPTWMIFDDDDVDDDPSLDDFMNKEDGVIEDEEEFDDGDDALYLSFERERDKTNYILDCYGCLRYLI
jgi:hypothetical protein